MPKPRSEIPHGEKGRMADHCRFLARLGAGARLAGKRIEGARSRAARKATDRISPFGLGARRAHSHHPTRFGRLRPEPCLRGKAQVAEGLLASQSCTRWREGVE